MTAPAVYVLFSEDVREEMGNTSTYVGVLNGDVGFAERRRVTFPKLVVSSFVQWDARKPPDGWGIQITLPDGDAPPLFPLPPSGADALVPDPDTGLINITYSVEVSPLIASAGSRVTVELIRHKSRRLVGILRFQPHQEITRFIETDRSAPPRSV
jgi:hypothetical protein